MEYLVDTNVLVYETILDSVYHGEVVSNLEKLGKVYVTTITLIELAIALWKLRLNNKLIIDRLRELVTENRYVLIDTSIDDIEKAIETLEKEDVSISSLNDKIILSAAKRLNLGIYTYDKKLRKQCLKNNIPTL